jgi:hypothetical protein
MQTGRCAGSQPEQVARHLQSTTRNSGNHFRQGVTHAESPRYRNRPAPLSTNQVVEVRNLVSEGVRDTERHPLRMGKRRGESETARIPVPLMDAVVITSKGSEATNGRCR